MAGLANRARSLLVCGAFVFCASIGFGCATAQTGATSAEITRARGDAAHGASIYASQCASCHGERGEGVGRSPAILGPGALPEYPRSSSSDPSLSDPQQLQVQMQTRPAGSAWRDPFRNAQDLHAFTIPHASKANANELKPEDCWAVVTYMLAAQGLSVPAGGVGPANASSIQIPKR